MSLENINEENDSLKKFRTHVTILMKKCTGTTILKIQNNIILFDYLVETQNFWKKRLVKFNLSVKKKLLEYKNSKKFSYDKYCKLLGYCCSYETRSGKLCNKKPVNGICILHKKFDNKLQMNVTDNTPLIKDLCNIIIAYIR